MKRVLIIVAVLTVAFTTGYAFAGETGMNAKAWNNGVTVFEDVTIYHSAPLALSRGTVESPGLALENHATVFGANTWFDAGPLAVASEQGARGAAAGGLGREEAPMYNGVTVFTNGSSR